MTGQSVKLADWPVGTFGAHWFDPCVSMPSGDDLAAIVTPQR
ncbi:MAG: hypothetical protein ABSG80_05935 [Verrucomicrobiota bacterium]